MRFPSKPLSRARLIEAYKKSGTRVESVLQDLGVSGDVEVVPESCHEDEQQIDCEATFRHFSGAYLLYARHTDGEQLDVAIPFRLNPRETANALLSGLKNLSDLIEPAFYRRWQ